MRFLKKGPRVHRIPHDYPVKDGNGVVPFALNPVQSYFLDNYEPDRNAIVESPTGTGKTPIAWISADSFLKRGKRVIYLAPTRSLVYEKYKEVTNMWGKRVVGLKTGEKRDLLGDEYMIVTTPESYISAIRKREAWAESSLIIADEIQFLIDPSRGGELDIALTIGQSRGSNVLGLSGYLPYKEEIAEWLRGDLFLSGWTPVIRHINKLVTSDKFNTLKELISLHRKHFIIVFVPTIEEGHFLSDRLSAPFHYRDLESDKKKEIENDFRKGNIRVLISTPTLAYGINTPTDVVVVYGTRRGLEYIDRVDVIQEIGRAGRLPKNEAWAYIIGDRVEVFHAFDIKEREVKLPSIENLILTKMCLGKTSLEKLKSLALSTYSAQRKSKEEVSNSVDRVCRYLSKHKLISGEGVYSLTGEGGILARYYLSPYRYINYLRIARKIEKNSSLMDYTEKGCLCLAEILNIPYVDAPKGITRQFEARLFQDDAHNIGKAKEAALLKGVLTGQVSPRPKSLEYSLRDAERWFGAFSDMKKYLKKDDLPLIDALQDTWKKLSLMYLKAKKKDKNNVPQRKKEMEQINLFEEIWKKRTQA